MLRRFLPVWKPIESMKFTFDDFVLDTEAFTLVRNGVEVGVELRVLEALIFLIRERHRVISKEELLDSVWDIDFASEATVFKAIQQARKAVGDDGKSQRLIKTVHGKGYRFVGEVEEDSGVVSVVVVPPSVDVPVEAENIEERPGVGDRRRGWLVAVAVVIVIGGSPQLCWRSQSGIRRDMDVRGRSGTALPQAPRRRWSPYDPGRRSGRSSA